MTFVGSMVSGVSQIEAGKGQSAIDYSNAQTSRRAALDAEQRGIAEADKAELQGGTAIGAARARAAASGIDVQSDNVLDVVGTTRLMSRWNAESIKSNAGREAAGYRAQAENFEAQSKMDLYSGLFGGMGSMTQGAGSLAKFGYDNNITFGK